MKITNGKKIIRGSLLPPQKPRPYKQPLITCWTFAIVFVSMVLGLWGLVSLVDGSLHILEILP